MGVRNDACLDNGDRRELLRASGPDLAAMLGAPDPGVRFAALRVLGRVFEKRPQDEPIETTVGDAIITPRQATASRA